MAQPTSQARPDYDRLAAQHGGVAVSNGTGRTYEVKDTTTGRIVTFRWNAAGPPTESDLEQVFAAAQKRGLPPVGSDVTHLMGERGRCLSTDPNAGEPLTLAQRVRTKYRGEYDDLTDQQLETKVRAKYPGVYDDLPLTIVSEEPLSTTDKERGGMAGYQVLNDIALGALKGVGNSVFGLGKVFRDYTPIGRISDAIQPGAFEQRPEELNPSNTAQRLGYTAEQVGEFFTPVNKPAKFAKAVEVAKAGLIGSAQGGPAAGAVSAGLTAAIPGGGAARRAAGMLERSAEKSVAQALGATKEWAKQEAGKLAPAVIARGVKGSRAAMLERATQATSEAGRRLGALYEAAGTKGKTISGMVIRGELQLAKDGLMVPNAAGKMIPVEGAQGVIQKLDRLEKFVEQLGDDVPVHHAAKIKTIWDRIVAKSGLYGAKAASNATDNEAAWAIREGAGSFRQLLNNVNPQIQTLNREYGFWKGLRDVLRETQKRTQAQGPGLTSTIAGGTGGTVGALASAMAGGGPTEALSSAFITATAAKQFTRLVQSPWWKTSVAAPMKAELAKALASGSASHASGVLSHIVASLPPQAKLAVAQ